MSPPGHHRTCAPSRLSPPLHMTHLAIIGLVHCPGRPYSALLRLLLPPLSLLLHLLLSPLPLRLRLLRPFLLLLTAPLLPLSALLGLLLLRGRRAPWMLLLLRGRRWLLLPGWRRGWSTATSRLLPRRRWWRKMWRGQAVGGWCSIGGRWSQVNGGLRRMRGRVRSCMAGGRGGTPAQRIISCASED